MRSEYDFSKSKRGAVITDRGKERITIFLDKEILSEFRRRAEETGRGYQTMINDALREYLASERLPVDEKTLRKVLREELEEERRGAKTTKGKTEGRTT